jgi:hypothetical protein
MLRIRTSAVRIALSGQGRCVERPLAYAGRQSPLSLGSMALYLPALASRLRYKIIER